MRLWPALLMLAVVGLCIFIATGITGSNPTERAVTFMEAIKSGNTQAAVDTFGDNTCNCAPPGGYEGYMRYTRGNEPNVAFLLGQQFVMGQPAVVPLPVKKQEPYAMPWEKQEEAVVLIPVSYEDANNRPFFLPLDMAFGYEMSKADLDKFIDDPQDGWLRGFTMRLRNRLSKDVVEPEPKFKDREEELRRKALEKTLPPEILRYIKPADAGEVKLPTGQVVTAGSLATELPRLKSTVIGLKVVRRGAMYPWTVKKLGVQEAVIVAKDKEFLLKEPGDTVQKPD